MATHARHRLAAVRRQDWALAGLLAALSLAALALARGKPAAAGAALAVAVAALVAARVWSVRRPGPMPHLFRWMLWVPRGPLDARGLRAILAPAPGERVLEIGPGIGVHALPIAAALAPGGRLDALDVQPAMLATLMRRAQAAGVTNLVPTPGHAERLPWPDATFDAAYLVGVLGEIPDRLAALRELRRVLKPTGRLVVGEGLLIDPDFIRRARLQRSAEAAGFVLEWTTGNAIAYFVRLQPRACRVDA
jgi:SAM-dependent methyltransferase